MGYGLGFGAGAGADMLQSIIKQRLVEQVQRHQAMMAEQRLAEDARQADLQAKAQAGTLDLGNRRLGLDTDKFNEDTRQFDALADDRQATRDYHIAQTGELKRAPQKELEARTFAQTLEDTRNKHRIGQITLQGNNAARIANIRAADTGTNQAPVIVQTPSGPKAVQFNNGVAVEVPLPPGFEAATGKLGTARSEKTVDQIRAEAEARAAGTKAGKGSSNVGVIEGAKALYDRIVGGKSAGTVKMIAPGGREIDVPAEQVVEAEKRGAKRVQ